ncbi:hypothetical protein CBER1_02126 [Cercospora berteroae]|uniref:NmrA-like domain-containing protein n=1 Tax=Cercospora berteroae TaxID=357750 RepID=A0A2S6C8K7_9PEZI|nr:hypothetical protein CBER1_02126 [Cercospora berteroae]
MKEILAIGGTGAQGTPVVHSLSSSKRFAVRVLTRNAKSECAQLLAALPNVTLIEGRQDSQQDLHRAFRGVFGACVNTHGFTIGEKNERYYGFRAYEIARHEGVQHYIYAATDYALKDANWDEKYHWGHNDAKGRGAEFILAQGQSGMKASILTTDAGKLPLIALEDVGPYALWMLDNPGESAGLHLKVATDEITFTDVAKTFTEVTGKKGIHKLISIEEALDLGEPFPGAMANWAAGPDAVKDDSTMTLLLGGCTGSLREWMEKVKYDGQPRTVLKGLEDLKRAAAEAQAQGEAQAQAQAQA